MNNLFSKCTTGEGVYFYKIETFDFEDNIKEINGFFHLVR